MNTADRRSRSWYTIDVFIFSTMVHQILTHPQTTSGMRRLGSWRGSEALWIHETTARPRNVCVQNWRDWPAVHNHQIVQKWFPNPEPLHLGPKFSHKPRQTLAADQERCKPREHGLAIAGGLPQKKSQKYVTNESLSKKWMMLKMSTQLKILKSKREFEQFPTKITYDRQSLQHLDSDTAREGFSRERFQEPNCWAWNIFTGGWM